MKTTVQSKGTRRPVAVLKFSFFQGLVASFKFSERHAPYLNVGRHRFYWDQ